MRQFNLEKAKAGKPVQLRIGNPVRILCFDAMGNYPIVGLAKINDTEKIHTWDNSGRFRINEIEDNPRDLIMAEESSKVVDYLLSISENSIYKKLEDLHKIFKNNCSPNTVKATVTFTNNNISIEYENKTAESLKRDSISMRNLKGDFITEED